MYSDNEYQQDYPRQYNQQQQPLLQEQQAKKPVRYAQPQPGPDHPSPRHAQAYPYNTNGAMNYPPQPPYANADNRYYNQPPRTQPFYNSVQSYPRCDKQQYLQEHKIAVDAIESLIKTILWGSLGIMAIMVLAYSITSYGNDKGTTSGFVVPFSMSTLSIVIAAVATFYCCCQISGKLYTLVMCICCMGCGCIGFIGILAYFYAEEYSQFIKVNNATNPANLVEKVQIKLSSIDESNKGLAVLGLMSVAIVVLALNVTFGFMYRDHLHKPVSYLFESNDESDPELDYDEEEYYYDQEGEEDYGEEDGTGGYGGGGGYDGYGGGEYYTEDAERQQQHHQQRKGRTDRYYERKRLANKRSRNTVR